MKTLEQIRDELLEVLTIEELDSLLTKLINKNPMSNLTLTGTLKNKSTVKQVSDNFSKIDFVVTDENTQYPQHVSFQAGNQKTALLDNVNEGDKITVSFNLRGREWTSPQGEVKYFNTLEAWKIEVVDKGTSQPEAKSEFDEYTSKASVNPDHISSPIDDTLPF
jgi:hypothetical protein